MFQGYDSNIRKQSPVTLCRALWRCDSQFSHPLSDFVPGRHLQVKMWALRNRGFELALLCCFVLKEGDVRFFKVSVFHLLVLKLV